MKKIYYLTLVVMLLSGCVATINSIVDSSNSKTPYNNILLVMPYEAGVSKTFITKLKDRLQQQFEGEQKKVEFIVFENITKELELNSKSYSDEKISNIISGSQHDIVLVFKPVDFRYAGAFRTPQSATYEVVGIDLSTKKEVWKAEFTSESFFGPAMLANKSARNIYQKLKTDRVL